MIVFVQTSNIKCITLEIYRMLCINCWTPHKARPVGRHRLRWMDQVEEDLKRMRITGWRVRAEDREEWSKIVEQIKTHPRL